jgi:hypothetical protein
MAKKRAAKRRPLKKLAVRVKANAKKRQVKRKKRRSTIVKAVKNFIGME